MRGQDAIDERRAGARHADDEDRRSIGIALAFERIAGAEQLLDRIEDRGIVREIIANVAAMLVVRGLQMAERLRGPAALLMLLRQRVADAQPVGIVPGARERGLEAGDVVALGIVPPEPGQRVMSAAVRRRLGDDRLEMPLGVGGATDEAERGREIVAEFKIARLARDLFAAAAESAPRRRGALGSKAARAAPDIRHWAPARPPW